MSPLVPIAAGGAGAATSQHHVRHHGPPAATLYVATNGNDTGTCTTSSSPCLTLAYAISQAASGDTILLAPGTYPEGTATSNVVGPGLTGLTISSDPADGGSATNTVIDATGAGNGIVVEADGVTVRGLTVENADREGILAEPPVSSWSSAPVGIDHVTIANNIVENNDKAFVFDAANPTSSTCPGTLTDEDDCGEGIHLLAASWSKVIGNDVRDNVGGILVSDGGLPTTPTGPPTPIGPADHNLIAWNTSTDNAYDCGITLPGHDPNAVATNGRPQPAMAGVYDNLVTHNVSIGNGGAGMLDATPYPGTGSYDNHFTRNFASDNGNGGFVLHSHAPQQDTSGIVVTGNTFGPNNLAGDPDTGVTDSTGVMLLSVAVPVSIDVNRNRIFSDVNGIAYNGNVTLIGSHGRHHGMGRPGPHNRFFGVATPYYLYTAP